jgi:hypothetical protein
METKRTLEEVIEEYKTNPKMTEKQKATLEAEMWGLRGPDSRGQDRRDWVSRLLGLPTFEVDKRARIMGAGEAGDPLWEGLEGDLSYHAANVLLVEARELAHQHRIPLKQAVKEAYERYQGQPVTKYLNNNKVVRGRGAGKKIVRDLSEEEVPHVDVKAVVEEKNFWSSIRKQFSDYAEKRLAGFDGIEKADIKRSFENELRTVIESLRVKIHLRASRRKTRISFSEVAAACETLVMEAPKRGALPDMELAKRRKRALAREYHSDHSGTSATNENLQEVLEAYALLESYCAQMKQSDAQGLLRMEGNNDDGGNDD